MAHKHEWVFVYRSTGKSLSMVACSDDNCEEIGWLVPDAESSDA